MYYFLFKTSSYSYPIGKVYDVGLEEAIKTHKLIHPNSVLISITNLKQDKPQADKENK